MGDALTARDVLDELDDHARTEPAFFPDFDHGYNYHVDARLSAYSDRVRWAITIEQLSVNPRSHGLGGIHTHIYYLGPAVALPPQPGWGEHAVQSLSVVDNGPGGPLLQPMSSEEINPAATDVRIRGRVVPIRTDANYYWARMIDPDTLTHEQIDQMIQGARRHLPPDVAAAKVDWYETHLRPKVGKFDLRTWHVMRGLVPEHRDVLLASEAERRRGLPADLPLLIQLDDWDHPRLMDGELPSSSDSFKQLARVIAQGDPRLSPPTDDGNVQWRHWPHSGSL